VVRGLQLRVVDAVELGEHLEEVGLAVGKQGRNVPRGSPELLCSVLGAHQLGVERGERQMGGEHGVLDVEQPVVSARQPVRLRGPSVRARVRG
jgi:hypothetical protein